MTHADHGPLVHDVTYWQYSDQEDVSPRYVTVGPEQISQITDPHLRSALGQLSTHGHIRDGMRVVPLVNADGSLHGETKTVPKSLATQQLMLQYDENHAD